MRTILFICTGNTCRSPMAQAIARHWIAGGGLGEGGGAEYLTASAGVAAADGVATSAEVVDALQDHEIVAEGRSKPLSAEMIRNAEIVLGMTASHVTAALALVDDDDEQVGKILRLDPDGDIEDPIGMGQEAYDRLARQFMELVPKRLKEVFSHEDRAGVGSSRG